MRFTTDAAVPAELLPVEALPVPIPSWPNSDWL